MLKTRPLVIPVLMVTLGLSALACFSWPTKREGTAPLQSGEQTAQDAQQDTLKDQAPGPGKVLYSSSDEVRAKPSSKPDPAPEPDPEPSPTPDPNPSPDSAPNSAPGR